MTTRNPLRSWHLGLTGGIGSGKSTVARMLSDMGAAIFDADAISRAATQAGGVAIPAIQEAFGLSFIDDTGALHRDRMRELIFSRPSAKGELEAIIHPIVAREIQSQSEASSAVCKVFDVPLLVESRHWRSRLDRVVVVDCLTATQVERVCARNGWSPEAAWAVIQSQASREDRLKAADLVIFNDRNGLEPLRRQVGAVAAQFGL